MRLLINCALLFALTPAVLVGQTITETTLYNFPSGAGPSSVMQANDGNFYGTTGDGGGEYDWGTIFKMTPNGTFSTVYSFTGINDGAYPRAGVMQASDGNFYGPASAAGYYDSGTIFKLTPSGSLTTLYSFRNGSDGNDPDTRLVESSSGLLYGVDGSSELNGYLYSLSLSGNFTTLAAPSTFIVGPLLQGSNGNFYACVYSSGVFEVSPSGSISLFSTDDETTSSFGLVEGSDGSFYAAGENSVIKISSSGTATSFYAFSSTINLAGSLLLASDGNFYGATSTGGTNGYGQVFQLTPGGAFTSLYSFSGGADGKNPSSSLLQGADGSLYGAAGGGSGGGGVLYKITLSPALSAPVALSFSSSSVAADSPVTLSWVVPNAASTTLQQCYASIQGNPTGAGTWTGLQAGAFSDGIYFGSSSITPTAAGTYTYALTCGGVESGFATLTVNAANRATTTSTLAANPNPATIGEYVTFADTVKQTGGTGTPTGKVTFYYSTNALSTLTLNGTGVASLVVPTADLPVGSYSITADYGGDANNAPSTSNVVNEQIKAAANAVLTASPSSVQQNSMTTLSAQVSSAAAVPTGSVTFYYGSIELGSGILNAQGKASLPVSANVPTGSYSLTAAYSGDASHSATTSAPMIVTVK